MLLIIIPSNSIIASSVTHEIDFELCLANNPVTYTQTTYLMTKKKSGYVNASSSVPKTGWTDLGIYSIGGIGGSGWINLSYDKSLYLTSLRMFTRTTFSVDSTEFYMLLYNKTTQWSKLSSALSANTTNSILTLMIGTSTSKLAYAVNTNYVSGAKMSIYNQINVSLIDNLGHGTLWRNSSAPVTFTCHNTSAINDNCRIDSIYFYATDWHSVNYIDDMNITLSDSYTGGGTSGCLDTSGLTQVGHFGYCGGDVPTSHVYKKYNIPVTTTISGIELQVGSEQYDDDPLLSNYELSINGVTIGNPICFNPESYYYVLQWDTSYTVTNDLVTFDFNHSLKTGSRYWAIGESCSSSDDLDADGDISYQYTDYEVAYEWVWILFVPFHLPVSTPYTLTRNRDLSMRWWCSGFPVQETYNYPDTLGLSNYYAENTTGYVYDVTLGYNTVTGSYTLGNPALDYTLELYHNGTQLYQYGFPLDCKYPGSGFGFSPLTIGKYYIRLHSTTYRANVTAWVTGTFPDFVITTNPTVTNQYESYNVNYRYYHPQGYVGSIAMDYYPTNLNYFTDCFYQRYPITNNDTSTFLYSTNSSNAEYWGLYAYVNNLHSKLSDATHYIRIPSIFDNDIHPISDNLEIIGNNQNGASMMLQGTHIFPGSSVYVYVNGIFLKDIGDSQYFTVSYTPTKIGTFNATLVLFQNNSELLLDYCSFTVSTSDTETPEDDSYGLGGVFDMIPKAFYPFIAFGIIIGLMFTPLAFIYSANKGLAKFNVTVNVPSMVMIIMSITMAIIGYTLDIMWGLLEWWTVFFLIFVLILVFAILWIYNK